MNVTMIFASVLLFSAQMIGSGTNWAFDASHAKVGFSISHFGISETEGKFTKFNGSVVSDKADFSDAQVDFSIDVSSINTEDTQRDQHLKSADFFDVAKYPSITFKSKSLMISGKNKYKLIGDLNMHGVTKEILLDVVYKGTVVDPYNHTKAGFRINGTIDRTQFGLTWNGKLSTGDLLVGNDVSLDINVELIKK